MDSINRRKNLYSPLISCNNKGTSNNNCFVKPTFITSSLSNNFHNPPSHVYHNYKT